MCRNDRAKIAYKYVISPKQQTNIIENKPTRQLYEVAEI